jgi:hypothetical protein
MFIGRWYLPSRQSGDWPNASSCAPGSASADRSSGREDISTRSGHGWRLRCGYAINCGKVASATQLRRQPACGEFFCSGRAVLAEVRGRARDGMNSHRHHKSDGAGNAGTNGRAAQATDRKYGADCFHSTFQAPHREFLAVCVAVDRMHASLARPKLEDRLVISTLDEALKKPAPVATFHGWGQILP